MSDTMSLLDWEPPSQRHSPTSIAAAESIKPSASTLRLKVLAAIKRAGEAGRTDDELQRELNMSGNTERPRRCELLEAGWIKESGFTRLTATRRSATVWVAT